MFDNNQKEGMFTEQSLDLGSDTGNLTEGFTPFEVPDIDTIFGSGPMPAEKPETLPATEAVKESVAPMKPAPEPVPQAPPAEQVTLTEREETKDEKSADSLAAEQPATGQGEGTGKPQEVPSLFDTAVAAAEEKQAETTKGLLMEKLPVFVYSTAEDEIVDISKTFDKLREEKAKDFPEMDNASAVSWKVSYGTIVKTVSTPKKSTIAAFKKEIEESKGFIDALKKEQEKKEKDRKEFVCKIMPSVRAEPKGIATGYKGTAMSVEEAQASGKHITYIPSGDGRVYEVRNNKVGTFITQTDNADIYTRVRAGFIPALPKIPCHILSELIAFFKAYAMVGDGLEVMAHIYWSLEDEEYCVYIPHQQVSKDRIFPETEYLDEEKFLLVMEIHSHNTMSAVFSRTDNKGEKRTGLYTVVGRLDRFFPEITTRISVGGKYVEISPALVFEQRADTFPEDWQNAVSQVKENIRGKHHEIGREPSC